MDKSKIQLNPLTKALIDAKLLLENNYFKKRTFSSWRLKTMLNEDTDEIRIGETKFSIDVQMAYNKSDIQILIDFVKRNEEETEEAMDALRLISEDLDSPEQLTAEMALRDLEQ